VDLQCQNCGAALVVTGYERTAKCPYCASPQIIERPALPDRPQPSFTIPFAIGVGPAQELVRGWLKSRGFFRDPSLKTAAISEIRGVYVPAYLYAAVAHSSFSASIGEDYQETESYTDYDANGNPQTRTRSVTRTEWRPISGWHSAYVMDVVVTASRGLQNAELSAIEPFDLRQMRRYSDALIAGWIAEEPTLSREQCLEQARAEALQKTGSALSRFMCGDRQTGLRYETRFENETADLMHVPVWVLAARHDPTKPPLRLLVNGQSGATFGHAPLSALRIAILIVLIVLAGMGVSVAYVVKAVYF